MKVTITTAYRLAGFVLANYWPKIRQVDADGRGQRQNKPLEARYEFSDTA